MAQVNFRFHAQLNYFLPPHRIAEQITHEFEGRVSIKDMIESFGIPHPEVDNILVNGQAVDFSYIVQDGDVIDVYPISEFIGSVRPEPLSDIRFVLDIHLGKLATSLRMLGFDTLYRNDYDDEELAQISSSEGRILLTRDRGLLKRSVVTHGYYVRSTDPNQQLVEVLKRFDLQDAIAPFHRCIRCNGDLSPVAKETIIDQLPTKVQLYYDEFSRCQSCQQVFWKGTHYEKMQEFVEQITAVNKRN